MEEDKVEKKEEIEEKTEEKKEEEKEEKGPTLFECLGMDQNKQVLTMLKVISVSLIVLSFGSFYLLRNIIPMIWKNVPRKDANVYACGISAILSHLFIFAYGYWARKHDLAEEAAEKEEKLKTD